MERKKTLFFVADISPVHRFVDCCTFLLLARCLYATWCRVDVSKLLFKDVIYDGLVAGTAPSVIVG